MKKLGIGTTAFLLTALAIVWSFTINDFCIGDNILNLIGIPAWSGKNMGTHYTPYYSLIFLIPAFILGKKYPNHILAKSGKIMSLCFGIFLVLSIFGLE